MPCMFGSIFTLPNVFLRPYFAFLEHRPSGQQWGELEPRRTSGWMAEEVPMFENWTGTTSLSYHLSWSILTCLPVSCHRTGSFFWPKPCQVTWWLEKQLPGSQHTMLSIHITEHSRATSILQWGSQLTQGSAATSKSNHIWSTRQALYRPYRKRHSKL